MEAPVISLERVTKRYGETLALDAIDLTVEAGEFLTVIGRSGCGKTTVLKLVNGLLPPDSGRVLVENQDVAQSDQIQLRRNIGYVIQGVGLFPHMTVGKNVAYVPSLSKFWSPEEENQKVPELLERVGLDPTLATRYPSELSGGQQQRVAIARAMAAQPRILLMDEPFGAVDEITRRALQDEFLSLWREQKPTVIFVTHDIKEALKLGSRVLVMDAGHVVQSASPEELLTRPVNDFVRDLTREVALPS